MTETTTLLILAYWLFSTLFAYGHMVETADGEKGVSYYRPWVRLGTLLLAALCGWAMFPATLGALTARKSGKK